VSKPVVGLVSGSIKGDLGSCTLVDTREEFVDTEHFDGYVLEFNKYVIDDVYLVVVNRHGINHWAPPHLVDYARIADCMRDMGVKVCVGISAVGSLSYDYAPGTIVTPVDFIDLSKGRKDSLCRLGHVVHSSVLQFDNDVVLALKMHTLSDIGYLQIQGPHFMSRMESKMYHGGYNGLAVVGMTAVSELKAMTDAGIKYASLSLVTDYDSWSTSSVDIEMVELAVKDDSRCLKIVLDNLLALGSIPHNLLPAKTVTEYQDEAERKFYSRLIKGVSRV